MNTLSKSICFLLLACFIAGCTQWVANKKASNTPNSSTTGIPQQPTDTAAMAQSPKFKQDLSFSADSIIHPYPPRYSGMTDTPNYITNTALMAKIASMGTRFNDIWRSSGNIKIELKITPEKFMEEYVLPSLWISPINELRFNGRNSSNAPGYEQWHYTQYHKGFDASKSFTFITKNGYIIHFETTFDPLLDVDTVTTFPIEQAWDSIKYFLTDDWRKYMGKKIFSSPYDYRYLPTKDEAEKLTYTVKKVLSQKKFTNKPEIQYKFKISDGSTLWVDAYNGTVIRYGAPVVHTCAQTCMVNTLCGFGQTYGVKNFCAELNTLTDLYELNDNSRGLRTLLYNGGNRQDGCYSGNSITHSSNNYSTHPHPEYASAHWALQQAWDYLNSNFDFQTPHSIELIIDAAGGVPAAGSNVCSSGLIYSIEIGGDVVDGLLYNTHEPYNAHNASSLDIIGHELAHSILLANTGGFNDLDYLGVLQYEI